MTKQGKKSITKTTNKDSCTDGILFPKLFWPTVKKKCSSDWETLLKFEAEGRDLQNFWDHKNNFFKQWKVRTIFSLCTLVMQALKVLIMSISQDIYFLPISFIFQFNLPDHPKQSCHFIFHFFFNLLSQIFNFHDNINLEKKLP